jgi:hypothetical protein
MGRINFTHDVLIANRNRLDIHEKFKDRDSDIHIFKKIQRKLRGYSEDALRDMTRGELVRLIFKETDKAKRIGDIMGLSKPTVCALIRMENIKDNWQPRSKLSQIELLTKYIDLVKKGATYKEQVIKDLRTTIGTIESLKAKYLTKEQLKLVEDAEINPQEKIEIALAKLEDVLNTKKTHRRTKVETALFDDEDDDEDALCDSDDDEDDESYDDDDDDEEYDCDNEKCADATCDGVKCRRPPLPIDERVKKILELRKTNIKNPEIAKEVGISLTSLIKTLRQLRESGMDIPKKMGRPRLGL